MKYTEILENSMFDLWNEEEDVAASVISFLNGDNVFRNFGEGLATIINKYVPEGYAGDAKSFLKEKSQENGITFNRNTLNNWFAGIRPKKGEQSREHMYLISFALGMNYEDTCDLFQKVYLDRPFNLRNVREFVYYYCVNKGLNYEDACSIISRISIVEDANPDGTIYTKVLKTDSDKIQSEKEVIDYIISHAHNFHINNKTAKEVLEELVAEVKATENDKSLLVKNAVRTGDSNCSYIIREIANYDHKEDIVGKYKSLTSVETMLDIITMGMTRGRAEKYAGKQLFANAHVQLLAN